MRILIVEDDPIASHLLRHTLAAAKYDCDAVSDGAVALEKIRNGRYQVIISDWEMPGMTGPALCRAVRAIPNKSYLFFILLTSRGASEDMLQGLASGADEFLRKPFDPTELLVRLRNAGRVVALGSLELTIAAMAKLAAVRDTETGKHVERVAAFSRKLAEALKDDPAHKAEVDDEFISTVYQTSALHDIGKVAIPDSILLKPTRLNEHEFAIMQSHTTHGAATLRSTLEQFPDARFLQIALAIVESHHEHWDGSGYPKKLKGDEIPLAARIVALADVYDALTTHRPYKPAWDHAQASQWIVSRAGKQFDPAIVEAFLKVEQRFIEIQRFYTEDLPVEHVLAA
jgi:putative two-component system response regulator